MCTACSYEICCKTHGRNTRPLFGPQPSGLGMLSYTYSPTATNKQTSSINACAHLYNTAQHNEKQGSMSLDNVLSHSNYQTLCNVGIATQTHHLAAKHWHAATTQPSFWILLESHNRQHGIACHIIGPATTSPPTAAGVQHTPAALVYTYNTPPWNKQPHTHTHTIHTTPIHTEKEHIHTHPYSRPCTELGKRRHRCGKHAQKVGTMPTRTHRGMPPHTCTTLRSLCPIQTPHMLLALPCNVPSALQLRHGPP